jgi:hypothetical protein
VSRFERGADESMRYARRAEYKKFLTKKPVVMEDDDAPEKVDTAKTATDFVMKYFA